ncbi:unnamed protein product [Heligmosomoides polygyrus]|uniref:Ephrin RBD domain-containing protein n=1 Tax=Heligmosomoides polygyrus TaxID=6339 RepID=A0A183G213_HELPZ|nr:unnamed protein product [Heligmosomoides polygyrus]
MMEKEVSEEEYTHCFLQNPHLVGSCNNNTQDVTITVVFRQFTPTPGGMEFEPGKTYHFITTSDGTLSGIDRRKDGLCTERQMKVKFEVELPKHNVHNANPKFAARTSDREVSATENSTPIMYIIHVDGEDSDELDGQCVRILGTLSLEPLWRKQCPYSRRPRLECLLLGAANSAVTVPSLPHLSDSTPPPSSCPAPPPRSNCRRPVGST